MLEYDFFESGNATRDAVVDEISRISLSRGYEADRSLPSVVAASWRRCLADYNLSPDRIPCAEVLTRHEFRSLEQDHEDLIAVAGPEIERLFERLVDSEYLVSLASAKGVMLLFRCDHQFLGDMSRMGVLPGSVWAEDRQGTNGVGTCLRTGRSVVISGGQHYGTATQALSCITAPILGRRSPRSVLNVTTPRVCDERTNRVVLDIVERSARRIENQYFSRRHRDDTLLRVARDVEDVDAADEGRIAVDGNGIVIDATSRIEALTGIRVDRLLGRPVDEVLQSEVALTSLRPDRAHAVRLVARPLQIVMNGPERPRSGVGAARAPETRIATTGAGTASRPRVRAIGEPELRAVGMTSQMLDRAERLFRAGISLVVVGESGSGKTAFAEAVARRCAGPDAETISVDCAALTSQQRAAAVFHAGSMPRPDTCLILDRVQELDEAGQIALQTFLEGFDRNGGPLAIIALSDIDLGQMEKAGTLRRSLLHRLKGGLISLPPVRSHPNLGAVVAAVLEWEKAVAGRTSLALAEEARLVLSNYHWPGNLRELGNALRHAVALAETDLIGLDHLPEDVVSEIAKTDLTARSQSQASRIEAALRHNNGNVSLTARYLGVSRATLYRKIQIEQAREKAMRAG